MSTCTLDPETICQTVEAQDDAKNNADGHDARGRFAKGNRGGPGNPFGRQLAAMRQVVWSAVTAEEMHQVMRMLYGRAMEGSESAARLLLQYMVGKPLPAAEPDRVDVEEWGLHRASNVAPIELDDVTEGLPVQVATVMAEAMVPAKQQKMKTMWAQAAVEHEAEKAAQAAEEAATAREVEEVKRRYREDAEYRRGWDELANKPVALDDVMGWLPPSEPSTHGANGANSPSPNGGNGGAPPSSNGAIGGAAPSPDGGNGRRGRRPRGRSAA